MCGGVAGFFLLLVLEKTAAEMDTRFMILRQTEKGTLNMHITMEQSKQKMMSLRDSAYITVTSFNNQRLSQTTCNFKYHCWRLWDVLIFENKKWVRAHQLMDIFMIYPIRDSENRRASPVHTKQRSISSINPKYAWSLAAHNEHKYLRGS